MPEGHTIHRLARDLNRSFRKKKLMASSPQGRFDAGAKKINGQSCSGFDAYGKHLIGHFDGGDVLHVHLGLIGKFRKTKGEPRGAVRLRLSIDDTHWDLRGPMVCDLGPPELADKVAGSVGPDPLRKSAKVEDFIAGMHRRRIPIGAALLDQKLVAGIGNVYRSELLLMAGVSPHTPANKLDDDTLETIWNLTVEQLAIGEKLNRIVTVDPKLMGYPNPRSIPKGERLYAYKREDQPCRICDTPIKLTEVAGRKMWECPQCQ